MRYNYKIFVLSLQALRIYLPGFLSLDVVFPVVFIKDSTGEMSTLLLLLALLYFQRASACVHLIIRFFPQLCI